MLATQQQIAQGLVDHPPEHYDLTEPYKRMPYDSGVTVWYGAG